MCGVTGIVNYSKGIDSGALSKMDDALTHRGPDGNGVFVSNDWNVGFGHKRLSIVDVEEGKQPIAYNHHGQEYTLTFNGEIYNHRDLRRELEGKGHSFDTHSDSEVVLKSYVEWGKDCLEKFNGQFAFAVYDGGRDKVFLGRDRLGIKPLYYSETGGSFVFASVLCQNSEPEDAVSRPSPERRGL